MGYLFIACSFQKVAFDVQSWHIFFMTLSRTRSWAIKFLSVLLPLFFVLGLLEILVRFIPPDLMALRRLVMVVPDSRPYVLKPDMTIPFSGMFTRISPPIEWRTNAQGLREDHVVAPRSTRFRIATYGDSEAFGWSVKSEDTFQKQMEAIDPRVQVINFGVPGYNATNIADHMAQTISLYSPDLIIYLVHKNDLDDSIEVSEMFGYSHLLLKLRLVYQQWILKPEQKRQRKSPERQAFFAQEVERMIAIGKQYRIPFILAFLHTQNENALRKYGNDQFFKAPDRSQKGSMPLPPLQLINLKPFIKPFPKLDHHLSPEAFRQLAQQLCHMISSSTENQCIPHQWSLTRPLNDNKDKESVVE